MRNIGLGEYSPLRASEEPQLGLQKWGSELRERMHPELTGDLVQTGFQMRLQSNFIEIWDCFDAARWRPREKMRKKSCKSLEDNIIN